jgi:adenylyltransferase/sulfurtransferase
LPTCDTAGVLGPAAAVVASLQATAAIKLLTGQASAAGEELTTLNVWTGRFRQTSLIGAKRPDCRTCGRRDFEFLDRSAVDRSVSLCGRNAIQVRPVAGGSARPDLRALAERLRGCGSVDETPHLVRCRLTDQADVELTVFRDGRAIIHGTQDPQRARSVYARWIGS